jgi:hypothetical protein
VKSLWNFCLFSNLKLFVGFGNFVRGCKVLIVALNGFWGGEG